MVLGVFFAMGVSSFVAWVFIAIGVILAATGYLFHSKMSDIDSMNLLIAGAVFFGLGVVIGIVGAVVSDYMRV